MSGTKRTPIQRRRTPTFSAHAVRLFAALSRAKSEDKRWSYHDQLYDALGCPPHIWPCVEMPGCEVDDATARRTAALREAVKSVVFNGQ